MTSVQPWLSPRPPTLEIPDKSDGHNFLSSDVSGITSSGALTPDVNLNSPLSLFPPTNSLLRIGNYVLAERLADISNGILSYRTVNICTGEEFICRVVPLDRCSSALVPFSIAGVHPNIDGIAEVIVGSTSAYAMHSTLAVCAEDLHAYVRRKRRLSEPEAARLFSQAVEAVVHCHRRNIVVRDIKLRRFLLADNDKTILKLESLYDAAVFDGTDDRLTDKHGCLAYVSPEILDATFSSATAASSGSSNSVNASSSYSGRAADMWSLGVMLYTMLVGRYPFADSDTSALFSRIRRGRYPNPDVALSPLALCLVRSLLAVNPNDRLTAEEALKHPWFSIAETGSSLPVPPTPLRCADDCVVPHVSMETDDNITSS